MTKSIKYILLFIFSFVIVVSIIFTILYSLNFFKFSDFENKNHKLHIVFVIKEFLKPIILPFRETSQREIKHLKKYQKHLKVVINQQNDKLLQYNYLHKISPSPFIKYELEFKDSLSNVSIGKTQDVQLSNDLLMKTYKNLKGFYSGIHSNFPGSGYIDFHNENLLVLSSRGILGYKVQEDNKIYFKQIRNNISEFINEDQFEQRGDNHWMWFSIKDLTVIENKIYISFTEEMKPQCWNTSIISANMSYKNIKFEKFFNSKKCISEHKVSVIKDGKFVASLDKKKIRYILKKDEEFDYSFNAHQVGGRIIEFDENHILFSVGDYRNRYLAQDKKSINGKIIKINILNRKYEVISMGHRNPQGLLYDKENKFLLETEHGPKGGDEINLIEINKNQNNYIPNFGWAKASYGEHYDKNKTTYKKYPLLKSHIKNNFIEPLHYFKKSVGVSEIKKIGNRSYVLASLRKKSLFFFNLTKDDRIINLKKITVFERIRDLAFKNNKLYLFLEDSASIGYIDVKTILNK